MTLKTTGYEVEATGVVNPGRFSHTENIATALGTYSHAEGQGSVSANGSWGHAEGQSTSVTNQAGHAEGYQTVASGSFAHAEGQGCTASGNSAHAEGSGCNANNSYTHAEGYSSTASGGYAHAEGQSTSASGSAAHAEGYSSAAAGTSAHAEGTSTQAATACSHAGGQSATTIVAYGWTRGSMPVGQIYNNRACTSVYTLGAVTTSTAAAILTADGLQTITSTGESRNVLILPLYSNVLFRLEITARRAATSASSQAWIYDGLLARDTGAVRVVASTLTTSFTDGSTALGTINLVLDNGIYAFEPTVTPSAATKTVWAATLRTTELTAQG